MAFCVNCGAKLEAGARFCTNCGSPVQAEPSRPQNAGSVQPETGRDGQRGSPIQGYYDTPGSNSPNAGKPGFTFENYSAHGKKPAKTGLLAVSVLLCILLAVALLAVVIAAVKGGSSDQAVLGRYEGISCLSGGFELGADGEWVELKSGKKAEIHILGETYRGKWALDGEDITITQDGDDYHGTLQDQVLQIRFEGLDYTFAMDGAALPNAAASYGALPTQPEAPRQDYSQVMDYWAGDWYGWWILQEGTGCWESFTSNFWDACARIRVNEDGSGYVEIWDEDNEEDEYFCAGTVTFDTAQAPQGLMTSKRGVFWNMDIDQGAWTVYPEMGMGVENGICISGKYIDPESPEDTFEYEIYLRPWGTLWDDLKDTDNPSCPYDDMMPAYYDSWYLPLIKSGVTQAPNSFEKGQSSLSSNSIMQDGATLGTGATAFTFTVRDQEGNETTATIQTDKTTIGDALMELGLIAGEKNQYGLYVTTVNRITLDYNADGWYWAFYVDGKYAISGVDSTEVTAGSVYSFQAEKG